jgi:hypothetical protein
MIKLLFLDVDGVLNRHEYDPDVLCGQIHRDKVALLNQILRATDAKVVLSSAWRYIVHRGEATLQGMDWLLRSHGMLANRLIGVTRPDTMRVEASYSGVPATWPQVNERSQQISDLLASYTVPVLSYLAVDDLDLGITVAGHPLVLTDGTVGLTEADAARAIELLNAKEGRANARERVA